MAKDYSKYFNKPSLNSARKRTKESKTINFDIKDNQKNLGKDKYYIIQTYGCQGNEADTESIKGILNELSFKETTDHLKADLVLLNTCAVRDNAENRIWGELGRLKSYKKQNPDLILGICGCMPQEEDTVNTLLSKYPYVDIIFGTHNIHKLPYYIEAAYLSKEKVVEVFSEEGNIVEHLPKERNVKHKAYVNIMFGCDEFCTYCIVPYTRGKERSRNKDDILAEINDLINDGCLEVTLLGQNVNAYGNDLNDYSFSQLLQDISATGIKRIRFTTSHPRDLTDETIECFRLPNVANHLHLPVQSGSNNILKKMNRKYTKEDYMLLLNKLRKVSEDISITTDIIVGFPNETDEEFNNTIKLVKEAKFEGAFTFIYSKREGTPAAKLDDSITEDTKKQRLYALNKAVNDGFNYGNNKFLNTIQEVIVDSISKNNDKFLTGYTSNNKLVNFKADKSLIGTIVNVKIIEAKTWSLTGELIND